VFGAVGDRFEQLAAARDLVLAEAESFRLELEPILAEALRGGLERVASAQAGHLASLNEPTRRGFEEAVAGATRSAVAGASTRLRDPDVWLSPHTAPHLSGPREPGWSLDVPSWLARLLRRDRASSRGLGDLDDPGNRIWVVIGSAAGPIDGVLQEFGFAGERRRIGGGRFGVAPRTLPRLDPSGALQRHWKRYRGAFERYESLTRVTG
jgi:hypothetical protein